MTENLIKFDVYMWCGAGYSLERIPVEAEDEEQALELAVVIAEEQKPWLFFDECEDVEEMEEQGLVLYVDATMLGACQPHYIDAQNLRIERRI